MLTIQVKKDQSLIDLAIEHTGSITGIYDLMLSNNLQGATHNAIEGDELMFSSIIDRRKQEYLKANSPLATIKDSDRATGIGFWRIGKTFKINS